MAGMSSDLDVLKDIPGYKAILKSVLKSQIQLLIEQLSDHTGEETIILTASVDDGTLSHLGSCTGKGFLNGRDEIKSQFLAFCLKSHHRKKTSEASLSPYQRPQSGQNERTASTHGLTNKRQRVQPVSLQRAGTGDTSGNSFTPTDMHLVPSQFLGANGQDSSRVNVKLESHEQPGASTTDSASASFSTNISLPSSIQLSHTQTAAESCVSDSNAVGNNDDVTEQGSENDDSGATSIKIEPITENEMELEITGVEPGNTSVPVESWNPVPGTNSVGEGASNEAGDQSGYNLENFESLAGFNGNNYSWARRSYQLPNTSNTPASRKKSRIGNTLSKGQNSTKHEDGSGKPSKTKFPCRYCGKLIRSRYDLGVHERIHTGEKPFICSFCGKGFTQKNNLESHKVLHLNLPI